jgi:hypothetical protein
MKYFALLIIPFFLGCSSSGRFDAEKVTAIHYAFYTDQVPGDTHTDYEIYIKPEEALFVANSFGTEVERQSTTITSDAFNQLVQTINECNLEDGSDRIEEPCTDELNEHLTIFEENKNVYKSTLVYCESEGRPEAASLGQIKVAFEAIFELVPGLSDLVKK